MRQLVFFCLILLFLLSGCETPPPEQKTEPSPSRPQATAPKPPIKGLFQQPLEPQLVELATGALPIWHEFREQKPALVVMSFNPFLKPLPAEIKQRATVLVLQGSTADIDRHGSYFRSDPVILPSQALSAAIEADLFSKIYWVFPSKDGPETLSIDKFRKQMQESEILSGEEADTLSLQDGTFSGMVRGVPFAAVHYQNLTSIQEPMLLHLDLSFFRGLYDNEIKTPLYGLISQTAKTLRDSGWNPLQVSCSYSTLQGETALETRFVMNDLVDIFRNPRLLDKDIPAAWKLRAEALYAADMFTESKKLELYRQAAELAGDDPNALYDLFQAHLQSKEIDNALAALDRAIELDPGYGAAYLAIANMAQQDGNPGATLRFLEKAATLYPLNPFVDFGRAELLLQKGDKDAALAVLGELLKLNWSPVYHPEIPAVLADMKQAALTSEPDKEVKSE